MRFENVYASARGFVCSPKQPSRIKIEGGNPKRGPVNIEYSPSPFGDVPTYPCTWIMMSVEEAEELVHVLSHALHEAKRTKEPTKCVAIWDKDKQVGMIETSRAED